MADLPKPDAPEWTDAEIEAMANVNAATIADARADALRYPELAALLEADNG